MSIANDILALNDLDTVVVEVPEWKCSVHVRAITGAERTLIEGKVKQLEKIGKPGDISAYVVSMCASDSAGNRLFTDAQVEQLNGKNSKALDRIALAAASHNGIGQAGVDQAKKD